jgi:hypothetical protein
LATESQESEERFSIKNLSGAIQTRLKKRLPITTVPLLKNDDLLSPDLGQMSVRSGQRKVIKLKK